MNTEVYSTTKKKKKKNLLESSSYLLLCSMAPVQVLFDQAGLGRGRIGGRGIGKIAAVWGAQTRDLL